VVSIITVPKATIPVLDIDSIDLLPVFFGFISIFTYIRLNLGTKQLYGK